MCQINRFDWRLIAISGDRRDAVLGVARFRSDQHELDVATIEQRIKVKRLLLQRDRAIAPADHRGVADSRDREQTARMQLNELVLAQAVEPQVIPRAKIGDDVVTIAMHRGCEGEAVVEMERKTGVLSGSGHDQRIRGVEVDAVDRDKRVVPGVQLLIVRIPGSRVRVFARTVAVAEQRNHGPHIEGEDERTLLWQIHSRRCSLQIHFRQCGHRCGGGRAMSSRMAWRTAGKVGWGGGPLILFFPPCC